MKTSKCPVCGGKMTRYGKTNAGSQRWRCASCKATTTHEYENKTKLFKMFLSWLLSRQRQCDMPGQGRTFRRLTSGFWSIWPLPEKTGEVHRVVYVDGIYLCKNVVVLVACSERHVLSWHLARSENSAAWAALLYPIAPPVMVVSDGGTGFAKARRKVWPKTRVQRCIFHVFCQIKRYTTSNPILPAGKELYALAKKLLHVKTLKQASVWLEEYSEWCFKWDEFLAEETLLTDGRRVLTHERLVKAKNSINTLINQKTLFTFLDLELTKDGSLPSTNNRIEGGVMAQLRHLLRDHRGMSITRRIKAVFWWCYMHTECQMEPAQILEKMHTDKTIENYYKSLADKKSDQSVKQWGDSVVWHELHKSDGFRSDWD